MHMVRLGVQGVELLKTGRISLPIREPWLTWLRDLRQGRHSKQEALQAAADLEASIEGLISSSGLPEEPRRDEADRWLVHAYRSVWDVAGNDRGSGSGGPETPRGTDSPTTAS